MKYKRDFYLKAMIKQKSPTKEMTDYIDKVGKLLEEEMKKPQQQACMKWMMEDCVLYGRAEKTTGEILAFNAGYVAAIKNSTSI